MPTSNLSARNLWLLAAATWTILIGFLCLVSFKSISIPFKSGSLDKIIHVNFHFFFTFFWVQTFKWTQPINSLLIKIIFASTVYGIVLEFAQYFFTNSRSADYKDVIANIFGSLLAAALLKLAPIRGK